MKKTLTPLLLFLSLFSFGQTEQRNIKASNGESFWFLDYVPNRAGNSSKLYELPVIIFLHGKGEVGATQTELSKVENNPIPALIRSGNFPYSFIVLSPQLHPKYENSEWPAFYVDEMIKYAKKTYKSSAFFLTGLSLGGGGVWTSLQVDSIASNIIAAAPICGTGTFRNPSIIKKYNIPIWAFHAMNDNVVGVGNTTSSVAAINNSGITTRALQTIYLEGGHSIWGRAYSVSNPSYGIKNIDTWRDETFVMSPNLFEWFLSKIKALPPPPPPTRVIKIRFFLEGKEYIIYSDNTLEVK